MAVMCVPGARAARDEERVDEEGVLVKLILVKYIPDFACSSKKSHRGYQVAALLNAGANID